MPARTSNQLSEGCMCGRCVECTSKASMAGLLKTDRSAHAKDEECSMRLSEAILCIVLW